MDNKAYEKDPEEVSVLATKEKKSVSQVEEANNTRGCIYTRQILCTLTIGTAKYVIGYLIGSTSLLPIWLSDPSNNVTYNSEDLKLLASIPNLLGIPASFLATLVANLVGPTRILQIGLLLSFLTYLIPVFSLKISSMWISRSLHFILVGVFDVVYIPLVAEFSEPRIRGFCLALVGIIDYVCLLYIYITIAYIDGSMAILCCSVPVFFGFLGSVYLPESPYWLIKKGRERQAQKSFERILGPTRQVTNDELLADIIISYNKSQKDSSNQHMEIFLMKKSKNWKPFLLCILIFAFREAGGHSIVQYYALNVFQEVSSTIDSFTCMVIVGVVALCGAIICSLLNIYFKRRVILFPTLLLSSGSLFVAGIFLYYDFALKIVPLIAIMMEVFVAAIGIGTMCYSLLGELIPSEVKFLGTGISYAFFTLFQFIVIYVTPTLERVTGLGPVFIVCSVVNLIALVVLFFILPETGMKSASELENLFD